MAPPAPAEAPDAALQRLLSASRDDDHQAWARLAELWQIPVDAAGLAQLAACEGAIGEGIYCLRASGPLGRLSKLNRPVILRLRKDSGFTSALLLGLDDVHARLDIGGERLTLPRSLIELHWFGDYRALWRAPEFVPTVLRVGDRGPGVAWVRERLAGAEVQEGLDGPVVNSEEFDAELERRLRRLQIRLGLVADGIAGSETQMALASYDALGPRLARLDMPPRG